MCNNVRHTIRDHEENKKFSPVRAYLMRIAELDMHPLTPWTASDPGSGTSLAFGFCNINKCCTEVCP